jgi:penicillin amidase
VVLQRFLKYINFLIGVVVVAALIAVYWFAWRPLPRTSGTLEALIGGPATIARDALGVPHIEANRIEDAIFLQGYATAQDRLWQMDAARRLASGELSEVAGAATLESDRDARRMRLRRIADQQARSVSAEDRMLLAAYARGVNYFIETHRSELPVEFTLLGYQPRPWTISDTLVIGLQMYRMLSNSWKDEILKANMLSGGDARKVDALFPYRTGAEGQPGSNAWAISGAHTASGKPLLASDPHLDWAVPSTWYLVHIKAPGLNVSGASLPGVPCVIIGHNERIAWGVTNLHFDVQDLYIERIDPQSGRYVFKNQIRQAVAERELIVVKGAPSQEFITWVTAHGPVIISEGGQNLSLRWTAAESNEYHFTFGDLDRAGNFDEFTAALARFPGPGQNFVYADRDGNIGYQAAGRFPTRRNYSGDIPVNGASGEFEWDGLIPFDQLPRAYNPPSGMIVTANQNPFPPDYAFKVSGKFSAHYRERQIEALLNAKPKGAKVEDMLHIQTDVYSPFLHFLAGEAVKMFDRRKPDSPSLAEAAAILRGWNGQTTPGQAAPLLATFLFQHLRKAIGERASPGKGLLYETEISSAVVEKLLRERPKDWFADWDQTLLRAMMDALEEGQRIQGRDPKKWDYGKYFEMTFISPVLGRLPWVGKYFNIGPVEMSGSSTSVKQTTRRLGPSMRMVVDLGDLDASVQNVTFGQSGAYLSSHYKDQWDAYYAGRSFPMQFTNISAKNVLIVVPAKK